MIVVVIRQSQISARYMRIYLKLRLGGFIASLQRPTETVGSMLMKPRAMIMHKAIASSYSMRIEGLLPNSFAGFTSRVRARLCGEYQTRLNYPF